MDIDELEYACWQAHARVSDIGQLRVLSSLLWLAARSSIVQYSMAANMQAKLCFVQGMLLDVLSKTYRRSY